MSPRTTCWRTRRSSWTTGSWKARSRTRPRTGTGSTDAELCLAPFVSDLNDDLTSLTVGCSDGEVTVEGLVLHLRHDATVPDRTVEVRVSYGDDEGVADHTLPA